MQFILGMLFMYWLLGLGITCYLFYFDWVKGVGDKIKWYKVIWTFIYFPITWFPEILKEWDEIE